MSEDSHKGHSRIVLHTLKIGANWCLVDPPTSDIPFLLEPVLKPIFRRLALPVTAYPRMAR